MFRSILYYPVYGLLYCFSLLPLRVLFLFSDAACFLLYRVFGYRKVVVMDNLRSAFKQKSEKELLRIAGDF